MKIQEFIEKAIDGGWGGNWKEKPVIEILGEGLIRFYYEVSFEGFKMSMYDLLLQPKAWEAVGKVEGWNCESWKYKENGDEIPDGYRRTIWQNEMKGMIDHLIEGGTIESYIETL